MNKAHTEWSNMIGDRTNALSGKHFKNGYKLRLKVNATQ